MYIDERKRALNFLDRLEDYCETYHEFPRVRKDLGEDQRKEAISLNTWLSKNGYFKGEFRYKDIVTDSGKKVEDIINELKEKYKSKKVIKYGESYVRNIFNEIKKYCENYKEFPRNQGGKKTSQAIVSTSLYKFLYNNGYFKNEFKFSGILTEDGKSIKDELDRLYKEYTTIYQNKKVEDGNDNAIKMLDRLNAYVLAYKDIPRHRSYKNKIQDKEAKSLVGWLERTGYYKKEFKFKGLKTSSGKTLLEEIDTLFLKYKDMPLKIKEKRRKKYALSLLKDVKAYCEEYKEWPKNEKNPKTEKEKKSKNLYFSLYNSGYINNEFKYNDIKTKNGSTVKDELDKLHVKYNYIRCSVLKNFKLLKEYCEVYQEWPKKYKYQENEKEVLSFNLAVWLLSSCYTQGDFKYKDIFTDEGENVLEEIDKLYSKYAITIYKHIKEVVINLIEYCNTYKEWPKDIGNPKNEKEKLSTKIWRFLYKSGYIKGDFKYEYIKIGEVSVKTIIDYYYFKYGIKDIWVAKDSHDIAATSYYYIISIWKELENNNGEMVKYYYDSLKNLLKNKFSNFDLEEIINILNQDIDIITEYFLHKYLTCSIENDTWIYFYKSLYEYSLYKKQNNLKKDR